MQSLLENIAELRQNVSTTINGQTTKRLGGFLKQTIVNVESRLEEAIETHRLSLATFATNPMDTTSNGDFTAMIDPGAPTMPILLPILKDDIKTKVAAASMDRSVETIDHLDVQPDRVLCMLQKHALESEHQLRAAREALHLAVRPLHLQIEEQNRTIMQLERRFVLAQERLVAQLKQQEEIVERTRMELWSKEEEHQKAQMACNTRIYNLECQLKQERERFIKEVETLQIQKESLEYRLKEQETRPIIQEPILVDPKESTMECASTLQTQYWEQQRRHLLAELHNAHTKVDHLEQQLADPDGIHAKHANLSSRYEEALLMLGEQREQVLELQADLYDLGQIYRQQIDELTRNR